MSFQEYEPVPQEEMPPLRRFYSDMFYKDNFIDFQIASEKLLIGEGICPDESTAQSIVDHVIGKYGGDPRDQQTMRDAFLLLPFRLIGPLKEADENYDLIPLQDWYKQVVGYVQKYCDQEHSQACLDSPLAASSCRCSVSDLCPWLYMAKELDSPLINPDFTDLPYTIDPKRAMIVAIAKSQVAPKMGLQQELYSNQLTNSYKVAYYSHFGPI